MLKNKDLEKEIEKLETEIQRIEKQNKKKKIILKVLYEKVREI